MKKPKPIKPNCPNHEAWVGYTEALAENMPLINNITYEANLNELH